MQYFEATVKESYEVDSKKGPVTKQKKVKFLVKDEVIDGVKVKVAKFYEGMMTEYSVVSIKESAVSEVI